MLCSSAIALLRTETDQPFLMVGIFSAATTYMTSCGHCPITFTRFHRPHRSSVSSSRPWRMGRSWWLLSALAAVAMMLGLVNIGLGTLHAQPMTHDVTSGTVQSSSTAEHALRPPLDSILQGKWNITGDPSWLLHFAIIGFPKCGTSTMMHHLSKHPQVSIFADERCDVAYNQQAVLIKDSYLYLGKNKTRGIKCPMLLESTQLGMRNMQKFFPKTHYIVGIRHPGTNCIVLGRPSASLLLTVQLHVQYSGLSHFTTFASRMSFRCHLPKSLSASVARAATMCAPFALAFICFSAIYN